MLIYWNQYDLPGAATFICSTAQVCLCPCAPLIREVFAFSSTLASNMSASQTIRSHFSFYSQCNYIMLHCSKALLDTNAHHHVFKESLFLNEYSQDQSPAIKRGNVASITSTSTLIHQTGSEITRKLNSSTDNHHLDEDVRKLGQRELYSQHTLFVIHQTNTAAVSIQAAIQP